VTTCDNSKIKKFSESQKKRATLLSVLCKIWLKRAKAYASVAKAVGCLPYGFILLMPPESTIT